MTEVFSSPWVPNLAHTITKVTNFSIAMEDEQIDFCLQITVFVSGKTSTILSASKFSSTTRTKSQKQVRSKKFKSSKRLSDLRIKN